MLHEHQSNRTDRRSSYKTNSYLMLEWWWFYCIARLLNWYPCSVILVIKNWQKYVHIVSKLYMTFLPHCTHASFYHGLSPFRIHLSPLCFHIHPLPVEPGTSQNPCLQAKNQYNPSWMKKSYHLQGALCPVSLLTNVKTSALLCLYSFPPASSSCQRKPVHFRNRKGNCSPANHSLSLC